MKMHDLESERKLRYDPILNTLLKNDIPVDNIRTNGYSYSFNFDMFTVKFVNQEHRIAGSINVSHPHNEMPKEEILFLFSGSPRSSIKNLLKLLKLPDEDRKLLGSNIFLEEDNFDVLITPEKSITPSSSYRVHQNLLFLPSIIKRIVLKLSNWFKNGKCEHKNMKFRKTFGGSFTSIDTWLNIYKYCETCGHAEFKYRKR